MANSRNLDENQAKQVHRDQNSQTEDKAHDISSGYSADPPYQVQWQWQKVSDQGDPRFHSREENKFQ